MATKKRSVAPHDRIVKRLQDDLGLSKETAQKALDIVLADLGDQLAETKRLHLGDYGGFKVEVINVGSLKQLTKGSGVIGAGSLVEFQPDDLLKKSLSLYGDPMALPTRKKPRPK